MGFVVSIGVVTPHFDLPDEIKAYCIGLKNAAYDMTKIRNKVLGFVVSIGLSPLIFDCLMKSSLIVKVWRTLDMIWQRHEDKG